MRIVFCVLALVCMQGCGGDAPNCEVAIRTVAKNLEQSDRRASESEIADMVAQCIRDRWTAEVRTCVSKAKTPDKLTSCLTGREVYGERGDDEMRTGRRSEAELNLDAIKKSAKIYFVETAGYPVAKVGLTPAQPCCGPGGRTKCEANAANWHGVPAWDVLDFEITEAHYFQYSYESDGKTYVARAVGDLDCDGDTVTFELRGTSDNGNQNTTLTKPPRMD